MLQAGVRGSRRRGAGFPAPHVSLLLWNLALLCLAAGGASQLVRAQQKTAAAPSKPDPAKAGLAQAPAATPFNAAGIGTGWRAIDGLWQFHAGDDPDGKLGWAQPGFDDSGWERLLADRPLAEFGHRRFTGFAWYRRQITLDPTDKNPLSFLLPPLANTAEVYWNGVKVGAIGEMPPHPLFYMTSWPIAIQLPPARGASSGVLAIRLWSRMNDLQARNAAGFYEAPKLGYTPVIQQMQENAALEELRDEAVTMCAWIVSALAGLAAFVLWLRSRSQWILFFVAIYSVLNAVEGFGVFCPSLSYTVSQLAVSIADFGRDASFLFLILLLADLPDRPGMRGFRFWQRICVASSAILFVTAICDTCIILPESRPGHHLLRFLRAVDSLDNAKILFLPLILAGCLVFGKRRLPRLLFMAAATLQLFLDDGIDFLHQFPSLFERVAAFAYKPLAEIYGSPFSIFTASELLVLVAIIYAVWDQLSRELAQQRRVNAEMKAAQEVQTVLVAAEERGATGYTVTSVYRPASEVGGDFFQVIPLDGDGTLIVAGDVSGKGLRAAMTVSMLVGAMRTLAEQNSSPAAILAGLNRRLSGRTQGGFVTCCAMRIDSAGHARVANAGHCQPYLDDREVELPAGLPLGLVEGMTYDEIAVTIAPKQQLTLVSDGVVEARNHHGELYGFERLSELMRERPSAEHVARTAIDFGQDDDITVLTVTRLAAEPSVMPLSELSPAPA